MYEEDDFISEEYHEDEEEPKHTFHQDIYSSDSSYQQQPLLHPSPHFQTSSSRAFNQGQISELSIPSIKLTLQEQAIRVFDLSQDLRERWGERSMSPVILMLQKAINRITRLEIHRNDEEALILFKILKSITSLLEQLSQQYISLDTFYTTLPQIATQLEELSMTRKEKVFQMLWKGMLIARRLLILFFFLKAFLKVIYYPLTSYHQSYLDTFNQMSKPYEAWGLVHGCLAIYALHKIRQLPFYKQSSIAYLLVSIGNITNLLYLMTCQYLVMEQNTSKLQAVALCSSALLLGQFFIVSLTDNLLDNYLTRAETVEEIGFIKIEEQRQQAYRLFAKARLCLIIIWLVMVYLAITFSLYSMVIGIIQLPVQGIWQWLRLHLGEGQNCLANKGGQRLPPIRELIYFIIISKIFYQEFIFFYSLLASKFLFGWTMEMMFNRLLKVEKVPSGIFCVICREDGFRMIHLPCGHFFHIGCIRKTSWKECSMCRQEVTMRRLLGF